MNFETLDQMETYFGGVASQWSRQNLINYRQDPSLSNWFKFLKAEVVSQNIDPLNHLPSPSVKIKPKVNPVTPWVEFNREMGRGKFTKEIYGTSQNATQARKAAYEQWKKENNR